MANTRIKDISTAATTLNSDDFIAVDGSTAGTRKMAKADLINEVSSGVSGTYLEESNNLSDVASLDTSKLNLEVPDVGTAPNEVPLNGMLGSMAYQDSAAISVGEVEADSITTTTGTTQNLTVSDVNYDTDAILTTKSVVSGATTLGLVARANGQVEVNKDLSLVGNEKSLNFHSDEGGTNLSRALIKADGDPSGAGFGGSLVIQTSNDGTFAERMRVDPQGRVGIGTSSPGSYFTGTDDLVVAGTSGDHGVTIATPNTANGGLMFADSDSTTIGRIQYSHGTNEMKFRVNNTEVWSINSSGNLVANGTAIDFGSGSTGTGNTVQSGLLDDFEEGSFTVGMAADSGTITLNPSWATLFYVKIGRLVYISGELVISSVSTPTGNVRITGVPFLINASITRSALTCYTRALASDIGSTVAFANSNSTNIYIRESGTTGIGNLIANQFQAGTELIIGGCYHTT